MINRLPYHIRQSIEFLWKSLSICFNNWRNIPKLLPLDSISAKKFKLVSASKIHIFMFTTVTISSKLRFKQPSRDFKFIRRHPNDNTKWPFSSLQTIKQKLTATTKSSKLFDLMHFFALPLLNRMLSLLRILFNYYTLISHKRKNNNFNWSNSLSKFKVNGIHQNEHNYSAKLIWPWVLTAKYPLNSTIPLQKVHIYYVTRSWIELLRKCSPWRLWQNAAEKL